jgi:hypothetical protein
MVVSSLKIAWHVPPMPGDRFNKQGLLKPLIILANNNNGCNLNLEDLYRPSGVNWIVHPGCV